MGERGRVNSGSKHGNGKAGKNKVLSCLLQGLPNVCGLMGTFSNRKDCREHHTHTHTLQTSAQCKLFYWLQKDSSFDLNFSGGRRYHVDTREGLWRHLVAHKHHFCDPWFLATHSSLNSLLEEGRDLSFHKALCHSAHNNGSTQPYKENFQMLISLSLKMGELQWLTCHCVEN